jgi:hypothetical protein
LSLAPYASVADAATVTIAWDKNPEPDVAGYTVHYGTSTGSYDYSVNVGNHTSCTISGLQEDTTYYFAATAYDTNNFESNLSEELVYTISDGDSIIPNGDSTPSNSSPVSSVSLPIQFDEIQIDNTWKHIDFGKSFIDPIVIANPPSLNGNDPAVVRIRNIDSNGFDIRIQEWNYLNETHALETVSYLVMERGSYTLENGARVEASRFSTDSVNTFGQVNFSQNFGNVPVVVSSITSFNGPDAVAGRVQNVNIQGFEYTMQEQESFSDGHTTESISYIAWEPSASSIAGITYKIGKTENLVDHNLSTIKFDQTFSDIPVFLADMQTANGMDTANVRWQSLNVDAAEVKIDEEQSFDSEVNHTTEIVGYMAFEITSFLVIQFDEIQIDNNWKRIDFDKSFVDPIVVANSPSLNGNDPAVVRIRNIDSNGFDIRIQEWNYLDETHALETVSYLVMERGSYTLADGTKVEAGRFDTSKVDSFGSVNFNQIFQNVPIVITSIASFNGQDAVTGRLHNISTNGFEFCMQEEQLFSDGHTIETIAFIAWEPSSGSIDGLTYEITKTGSVVNQNFHTIQFTKNFTRPPLFLADMQTADGIDTANVRWQNKNQGSVQIQIDEEQSVDSEIEHTNENVGYFIFVFD